MTSQRFNLAMMSLVGRELLPVAHGGDGFGVPQIQRSGGAVAS